MLPPRGFEKTGSRDIRRGHVSTRLEALSISCLRVAAAMCKVVYSTMFRLFSCSATPPQKGPSNGTLNPNHKGACFSSCEAWAHVAAPRHPVLAVGQQGMKELSGMAGISHSSSSSGSSNSLIATYDFYEPAPKFSSGA